jgi:hypothetical protein
LAFFLVAFFFVAFFLAAMFAHLLPSPHETASLSIIVEYKRVQFPVKMENEVSRRARVPASVGDARRSGSRR